MSELSGLDLRRAACEALEIFGCKVCRDKMCTDPALPAIESGPAVSEPMFLEWAVQRNFAWEMTSNMPGSCWLDVADTETRLNDSCVHIRVHGETPSEARARAIVAAAKEPA